MRPGAERRDTGSHRDTGSKPNTGEPRQAGEPGDIGDPQDIDERVRRLVVARVRPGARDGRLSAALGVVAVLIGLAMLKPWGAGTPRSTPVARVATPAPPIVTPEPTQDRSAEGLAAPVCLGAGGWQVTSLEQWETQGVRVWRAIDPATDASGPLDPDIPSVPIVAAVVTALGWCAPTYGPHRATGPATITGWWVASAGATVLPLEQVQPVDGVTPFAALYRPAPACPKAVACPRESAPSAAASSGPVPAGAWTSGRVIFHWVDEGAGTEAWLGADLTIMGGPSEPPG